ncbi:MAG: malonyl-[acyl-carrier protein] O-methyltransferase BioC [Methylobacter sp.]|nr:MAG: malonyl-[acyl-carrier protein] O-methyltransferase BioC [Methylobacter sp.]
MAQIGKNLAIDKLKVRQSFSLACNTYDAAAGLQRIIADRMINAFNDCDGKINHVLDLGCGTGYLTKALQNSLTFDHLFAVDIALPMLVFCREKNLQRSNFSPICADAANLPFRSGSIDLITANLVLQWLSDLHGALMEIKRLLKPCGQLLFSTFGPQTLQELKQAWAQVDQFSHVNEFYHLEAIRSFLLSCGFKNIVITSQNHVMQYDSVFALMRELKDLGAHNVTSGRNKQFTSPGKLNTMIAAYEAANQSSAGIKATYEVILVSAKN